MYGTYGNIYLLYSCGSYGTRYRYQKTFLPLRLSTRLYSLFRRLIRLINPTVFRPEKRYTCSFAYIIQYIEWDRMKFIHFKLSN